MTTNPLLILCVFLLLRRQGGGMMPSFTALQLESLIDQAHALIHTMEKVSSIAKSDLVSSLPDMKKMLEAVEKIPL